MGYIAGVLTGFIVASVLWWIIFVRQLVIINELTDHSEDKYDTRGKYN
jgi:hypothetical protein